MAKLNLSIIGVLQSIAPQLLVSFLVGCLAIVVSNAVISEKLNNMDLRVAAVEIDVKTHATTEQLTDLFSKLNQRDDDIIHRLDIISGRLDKLIIK